MARKQSKPAHFTISGCLIADSHPGSVAAEQYRMIRNNIRYASNGRKLKSLAVTSPSEGEGKSTAAVNLAVSMAQRGDRVLLVDANVKNPILHYIFKSDAAPGLTDILMGQSGREEAAIQTEIDGLSVLTCGSLVYDASELLDSISMNALLEEAEKDYDLIVMDCPSVLGTADANALAGKCDGVVLVIKCGKTNQIRAIEAKKALEFCKTNLVGAILNQAVSG